jgi:signal transduction histidine kinase
MPVEPSVSPGTQMWRDAQAELTPAKSLARINDNAKFLAGSVSLVGSLVTAAGLISIDRLRVNPQAAAFATAAAALATVSVLIAVGSLILRVRTVHIANLLEVRQWYISQLRKGIILAVAGWALVTAIVLAACAALFLFASPVSPSLSLQLSGQGATSKLSAKVGLQGLSPGTRVETQLDGENAASKPVVLAVSTTTADANGKVDLATDLTQPGEFETYRLTVTVSGSSPVTVEISTKR